MKSALRAARISNRMQRIQLLLVQRHWRSTKWRKGHNTSAAIRREWTPGQNSEQTTRRNKNVKSRSETVPNLKMLWGGFNCGYNVFTWQYNH